MKIVVPVASAVVVAGIIVGSCSTFLHSGISAMLENYEKMAVAAVVGDASVSDSILTNLGKWGVQTSSDLAVMADGIVIEDVDTSDVDSVFSDAFNLFNWEE